MTSGNCQSGEHTHCAGVLKFADPEDGTQDITYSCDCGCHSGSKQDHGLDLAIDITGRD